MPQLNNSAVALLSARHSLFKNTPAHPILQSSRDEENNARFALDNAKIDYAHKKEREEDFNNAFVEILINQYYFCKEIADSSEETWKQWVENNILKTGQTVLQVAAAGVAIAAASKFGVNNAPGFGNLLYEGIGALCRLWNVKKHKQAQENARAFLALIEDINGNIGAIKLRFGEYAELLSKRFSHQIRFLDLESAKQFAIFFARAIIKQAPFYKMKVDVLRAKIDFDGIQKLVINQLAVLPEGHEIYKDGRSKIQLKAGKKDWTIEGMLWRSTLIVNNDVYI